MGLDIYIEVVINGIEHVNEYDVNVKFVSVTLRPRLISSPSSRNNSTAISIRLNKLDLSNSF